MIYMLDTSICVFLIRQKPAQVLENLAQHPLTDVVLSAMTVAELEFGVHKSTQPLQNQHALAQFLLPLTILDFHTAVARAYGQVRLYLETNGLMIGTLDTLIAAHALSRGLYLVTNSVKEFSRVPGLVVEDCSQN